MKLNHNLLHEENVELQSQLNILNKKLEQLQVEKKRLFKKYREMKDKTQHDIAIQTDLVGVI